MTAIRAEYLADIPSMYRGLAERAFAGKLSPRSAIRAKCLACVGFVRADVTGCTSVLCELWPLRPYQRRGSGDSTPESTQADSGLFGGIA